MDKVNFPHTRRSSLADELTSRPEIAEYVSEHGISREVFSEHAIELLNWADCRKACASCRGLMMCSRPQKGYQLELDDELKTIIKPCAYLSQSAARISHGRNYLINDLPESALTNDIDRINAAGESAEYLEIVSAIRQWLDEPVDMGFYFYGGLGVGKTYLASCITNRMARQGYKVAFVKVPALASGLRANLKSEGYVEDRLRRMKRADVLVLDDIGAENITEWIRDDILFAVLDYRMENHKYTFFTSNSNLEALTRRMMIAGNSEDQTKALRIIERIRALSYPVGIRGTSRRFGRRSAA